jgi:hypothetical protein
LLSAVLAALACALVVAGCGSDSSSSSDSDGSSSSDSPPITQALFVVKGDGICEKGRKEVEADFAAYLKKEKIKELGESSESAAETKKHEAEIVETIALPALREQVEKLKALGIPDGAEDETEEFLEAVEEDIAIGEEDPQALFSSAEKTFAESDKIAKEIGFEVCGNR